MSSRKQKINAMRMRRLFRMSTQELDRLNMVLIGKGHHWITNERSDVCGVLGMKTANKLAGL